MWKDLEKGNNLNQWSRGDKQPGSLDQKDRLSLCSLLFSVSLLCLTVCVLYVCMCTRVWACACACLSAGAHLFTCVQMRLELAESVGQKSDVGNLSITESLILLSFPFYSIFLNSSGGSYTVNTVIRFQTSVPDMLIHKLP